MTTSSLKSAAATSQNLLRNAAPTASHEPIRQPRASAPRARSTAARRFLNVLMNSLSAWAV
jgi:hypothetical protein